ncbi:hypothetical protein [Pseudonocardia acaciae]|uniref:hypothetical protein n=1 Tax=Pseudonocardia acaciae TaxID=551276 RepID=UPI00048B5B99|nr:hypothetical protein [Pseudonocardia acaciae]
MKRFPASPRERLAAGALVAGAAVFVGMAVAGLLGGSGATRGDLLTLAFALLGADLVIAAALLTGWYPVRPVAQGLAIFGALVHVLVLLRSGPWWMRGWSGLLAAAHLYGLVLLFALSSREQYEDELDDEPEAPEQPPAAPDPAPVAAADEADDEGVHDPTADRADDPTADRADDPSHDADGDLTVAKADDVDGGPTAAEQADDTGGDQPGARGDDTSDEQARDDEPDTPDRDDGHAPAVESVTGARSAGGGREEET